MHSTTCKPMPPLILQHEIAKQNDMIPNIFTGVRATTFEVYGLEATTEYEAMVRKAKAAM